MKLLRLLGKTRRASCWSIQLFTPDFGLRPGPSALSRAGVLITAASSKSPRAAENCAGQACAPFRGGALGARHSELGGSRVVPVLKALCDRYSGAFS